MRKRSAAFTLIEVLICLAVIAVVSVPVLDFFLRTSQAYQKGTRWNDLKHETDRIGYKVVGLLRASPSFTIGQDNRSVTWDSQKSLRWNDRTLHLRLASKGHPLSTQITHFSLLRRNGKTQLTLECTDEASGRRNRRTYQIEADSE